MSLVGEVHAAILKNSSCSSSRAASTDRYVYLQFSHQKKNWLWDSHNSEMQRATRGKSTDVTRVSSEQDPKLIGLEWRKAGIGRSGVHRQQASLSIGCSVIGIINT